MVMAQLEAGLNMTAPICRRTAWFSVISVVNIKTANFCQFATEAHPLFLFLLQWSDGSHSIFWCSQLGNQNFSLFILSGGIFCFHCLQGEMPHSKRWRVTWSSLINWLGNHLQSDRQDLTRHILTCDVASTKKSLGKVARATPSNLA